MTEEKNSNENMDCSQDSPCRGNKVKIAIFVIVLLLAGAIAAHSIIAKNNNTSCPLQNPSSCNGKIVDTNSCQK